MDYLTQLKEILTKVNQEEAAPLIGVTVRSIQSYISEESPSVPHLKTQRRITEVYTKMFVDKVPIKLILPARSGKQKDESGTFTQQLRDRKNADNPDRDGIIFVPIAAQANYSLSFTDPVFIDQLERIYMPGFPYKGEKYRVFEVAGDSMEPTFKEGYYVVTEHIEQDYWETIADFYVYVVVLEKQVLIKRVFRRKEAPEFILISDNDYYPQAVYKFEEVKDLWVVKRKLDWEMSPPKRFEINV